MCTSTDELGIVLHYNDENNSAILLDNKRGKIKARSYGTNLSSGMVIAYDLEGTHYHSYQLKWTEVLACPEQQAQQDILFLHHVLELCDYFIPLHVKEKGVYSLLKLLCTGQLLSVDSHNKKRLFLFKLSSGLGLYPQDSIFHTPFFYRLAQLPIKEILHESIDDTIVHKLNKWLHDCIAQHPFVDRFKTICFLTDGKKL